MPDSAVQEPGAATRQKILEAARKVFRQKGYEGARMREIATEAGVNLALMNYHFGSKEALFQAIYIQAFAELRSTGLRLLDGDQPLAQKIPVFLDHIFSQLQQQPELPAFVFTELHRTGGELLQRLPSVQLQPTGLIQHVEAKAAADGQNPAVVAFAFALLSAGMGFFPYLLQPIILHLLKPTGASFEEFLAVWKAQAAEVLQHRGQQLGSDG